MIGRMACAERDHLHTVLRIATHELKWALEELDRILNAGGGPDQAFREVVEKGIEHHRSSMSAYHQHIAEHGCAAASASSARP
jgi:hypothetical protein